MDSFRRAGATVAVVIGLVASGFLAGQAFGGEDDAAAKQGSSAQVVRTLRTLNSSVVSVDQHIGDSPYGGGVMGSLHALQGNLYDICRALGGSGCSLTTKR